MNETAITPAATVTHAAAATPAGNGGTPMTPRQYLDHLLAHMVHSEGSDLIIKENSAPLFRIHGDLLPAPYPKLTTEQAQAICYSIISDRQRETFEKNLELDLAHEIPGLSRFRVNLMYQRGSVTGCLRAIPITIKTMEDLNLPAVCRYFCERPRGLVLVTGPTGSGKTTSLAAMINYINERMDVHIMTVEDPVEFVHEDKKALINQRELGTDTLSFANALKYVLRQDPDVILVGEMRDLETISLAITAAETGHLVFGTLHTTDAVQTVDRIIDVFPTHQQQQVRMQMSVNLIGVVSQTLLKTADGRGRVAAFETMVAVPAIRNLIREAKTHQINSTIQTGARQGMMTLDQNLAELARKRMVSFEEAAAKAGNLQEFMNIYGEAVSQDELAAAQAARKR
ncbi:MAG TPA: type IV pilus twitching motility protein PilT [Armatimonadota bacterium]|jgi:twitching motility protein PilT